MKKIAEGAKERYIQEHTQNYISHKFSAHVKSIEMLDENNNNNLLTREISTTEKKIARV